MQAKSWGFEVRPWVRWEKSNILVSELKPVGPSLDLVRLGSFLGARYDYRAALLVGIMRLLGRYLKSKFKDPRKLMCSEAIIRVLQWSGYRAVNDLDPEITSPGVLMRRCMSFVPHEFSFVRGII